MFQELSLEARREMARVFQPKRALRGTSLYALGDRADGVYLVREGLVWLEGPRSAEGEPATLGVLGVKAYVFLGEVIGGQKPKARPEGPRPEEKPRRRRPAVRVKKEE
ncbi:hypothetical protein CSW19_05315 [Thermus scotoductus]|nr:hypothetical protein [Thermus scotoductus]RTI21928.1 hypothetical protein CSW19_05315 [Thermus scotoductus]